MRGRSIYYHLQDYYSSSVERKFPTQINFLIHQACLFIVQFWLLGAIQVELLSSSTCKVQGKTVMTSLGGYLLNREEWYRFDNGIFTIDYRQRTWKGDVSFVPANCTSDQIINTTLASPLDIKCRQKPSTEEFHLTCLWVVRMSMLELNYETVNQSVPLQRRH